MDQLHHLGVRVIGRVVAFRDPVLADWAWTNGHRDWVLQHPGGVKDEAYGGFTNFANGRVEAYNTAIAVEGAEAGVDEILWDYVRRPEGDLAQLVFPGLTGTPEDGLVAFLAQSHTAAARPGRVPGRIGVRDRGRRSRGRRPGRRPRSPATSTTSRPMVYPSLWVAGEYRVPRPGSAALRHRPAVAAGLPGEERGHRGRASPPGCRPSRWTASPTDRPRSGPRSTPPPPSGSTASCSGARWSATTATPSTRMGPEPLVTGRPVRTRRCPTFWACPR